MEDNKPVIKPKVDKQPTLEDIIKENENLKIQIKQLKKENNVLNAYKDLFEAADGTLAIIAQALNNYKTTTSALIKKVED